MMLLQTLYGVAFGVGIVLANPLPRGVAPTVKLDNATFTGNYSASGKSSEFLGIPFAKPPTGDLRFRLPVSIPPYTTSQTVTSYGPSCPQQASDDTATLPASFTDGTLPIDVVNTITLNQLSNAISSSNEDSSSEDCLTINVVIPADITPDSKLPVVVWIYGGAFELGDTSSFNGSSIVESSIALGEPIIYVSMNYRVTAFGFLASKEVKAAGVGNIGLQDQREALRWVQKYIVAFGGDSSKVTIWGESAGAISVALQMVTNGGDTEGLFRAGFMESGSPLPVGDISHGQTYYDFLVEQTGCSNSSDTLECLRGVPYDTLKAAVDKTPSISSYQSIILAWLPRVDGVFLTDNPQNLVQKGQVAKIPIVNGDCDDEGTVFSFSTLNITTTEQLQTYIKTIIVPNITDTELEQLESLYPDDPTQGSPFDTGTLNAISPQFKRIAAIFGDMIFQAPRRFFLQSQSGKQPIWSYVNKRNKSTPTLGSYHGSDLTIVYNGGDLADYLVQFVTNLDPNGGSLLTWPGYTTESPNMMTFVDGPTPLTITQDDYRKDPIALLTKITLENPI